MRGGERSVLLLIGSTGVAAILDALCRMCLATSTFYRFRPSLADPKDDLYVECALASRSDTIITFDGHFDHRDLTAFGLRRPTPRDILIAMGLARQPT